VCAMIFKSIRFFSFGKVILSCVCTHTHNQNKRQSFTLYIYSVEYIIIWRDWMMLILKYFHITEMYFSFFAIPGNDKQLCPIFFSRRRYAFFFFLSWCLSWKYTQHIQSNESRRVPITPAFNAKKRNTKNKNE
jgi:hypothetical protein